MNRRDELTALAAREIDATLTEHYEGLSMSLRDALAARLIDTLHDTLVGRAIDTHVWCESDGNSGVVPARHHVYEMHGSIPPSHPDNPICDGTRATHTPLYLGDRPPADECFDCAGTGAQHYNGDGDCPSCGGTGDRRSWTFDGRVTHQGEPCPSCGGRGRVSPDTDHGQGEDMSNTTPEYVRDMDAYQEALAKAQGNPVCNAHVWIATPTEVRMRVDCNRIDEHTGERTVVTAWGETNAHWHKPTDEESWFLEWYDDTPFAEPNTIRQRIKVVRSEPMEDPTTTAERESDATHVIHGHDGMVLAITRSATGITLTQLEPSQVADLLWDLSEALEEADS